MPTMVYSGSRGELTHLTLKKSVHFTVKPVETGPSGNSIMCFFFCLCKHQ